MADKAIKINTQKMVQDLETLFSWIRSMTGYQTNEYYVIKMLLFISCTTVTGIANNCLRIWYDNHQILAGSLSDLNSNQKKSLLIKTKIICYSLNVIVKYSIVTSPWLIRLLIPFQKLYLEYSIFLTSSEPLYNSYL